MELVEQVHRTNPRQWKGACQLQLSFRTFITLSYKWPQVLFLYLEYFGVYYHILNWVNCRETHHSRGTGEGPYPYKEGLYVESFSHKEWICRRWMGNRTGRATRSSGPE